MAGCTIRIPPGARNTNEKDIRDHPVKNPRKKENTITTGRTTIIVPTIVPTTKIATTQVAMEEDARADTTNPEEDGGDTGGEIDFIIMLIVVALGLLDQGQLQQLLDDDGDGDDNDDQLDLLNDLIEEDLYLK